MNEALAKSIVDDRLQEERDEFKGSKDYREFEYGHLIFECNRCSHRQTIEKDVRHGISISLPTTNKHVWTISCPKCKNTMKFFFLESFKKDEVVEQPITVTKKTRKKRKTDELKEDNKTETSS